MYNHLHLQRNPLRETSNSFKLDVVLLACKKIFNKSCLWENSGVPMSKKKNRSGIMFGLLLNLLVSPRSTYTKSYIRQSAPLIVNYWTRFHSKTGFPYLLHTRNKIVICFRNNETFRSKEDYICFRPKKVTVLRISWIVVLIQQM